MYVCSISYVRSYLCFLYIQIIVRMTYWFHSMLILFLFLFLLLLLLIFRSHSLVYSSLSLPLITCRTYHGVSYLYSYIYYLSISVHTSPVIPNATPVLIPTSLCHSNQFPFSFSSIQLLSVFFLFLSICSRICTVAYSTF